MAGDAKLRGLGRGLSALLGEDQDTAVPGAGDGVVRNVPIEHLRPGRAQPRHRMDEEGLAELAQSIAEKGILQPILVRAHPEEPGQYEIVAGERRWRAAQLAQVHEIPVLVRTLSDSESLEIALIENLQRQDLTPLEEADGYRRLIDEHAHTQDELAKRVGKSRSHVANTLRLLALPDSVKTLLDEGRLTAGHARALLTADNPETLARTVIARALNVRDTEKLASAAREKGDAGAGGKGRRSLPKDADTLALERDLGNLLGLTVEIRFRGSGGSLVLHYTSLDQLDDILHRLRHNAPGQRAVDW